MRVKRSVHHQSLIGCNSDHIFAYDPIRCHRFLLYPAIALNFPVLYALPAVDNFRLVIRCSTASPITRASSTES